MAHSQHPQYMSQQQLIQQQLVQQQQQYELQQALVHTHPPNQQNHHEVHTQQQQQQQHPQSHTNNNNHQQAAAHRSHSHSHHRDHTHGHHHKKTKRRDRVLKTRVFASGYNYNFQFGLEENENHADLLELKWCRGLNISYICSGLTHNIYLSFTGNYYFCGQIDCEKLGYIDGHTDTEANIEKITKSTAANLEEFNNGHTMRITRVGDGVSSRHMLVLSKHRAFSMGLNQRGQLGLGHFRSTLRFHEVQFDLSQTDIDNYVALDVIDVSCGEAHSAFVVLPHCTLPIKHILRSYFRCYKISNSRMQHLIYEIVSKFIISSHSLLRDARGRLYVCGCNNFGQLGIGNNSDASNSAQCMNRCVRVSGGGLASTSVAQVSCGENHTVCLDNRGRVYCFGDNYYGQSGVHVNHYENVYYPLKIEHFKKQYAARIVKISSGKYHCVALDKMGRVFCWGLGAYGQLGCNKLNKRIILPIYVESLHDIKVCDVRAGMYHTAALSNTGKLFCWGSNNYGQCFQNVSKENILTPHEAQLDAIQKNPNLVIYKMFCGYYSTIILARDLSQ